MIEARQLHKARISSASRSGGLGGVGCCRFTARLLYGMNVSNYRRLEDEGNERDSKRRCGDLPPASRTFLSRSARSPAHPEPSSVESVATRCDRVDISYCLKSTHKVPQRAREAGWQRGQMGQQRDPNHLDRDWPMAMAG